MLNNKQFNIRECVEESLQAFSFQAENENKELHVEMNMSRTELFGDPFRIGQILNNLLSNAMKFTREGGTVTLKVEQIGSGDFLKYKFVVADTGIGMSKEFLEQIFEPYAREMRFSAKQATGTGLGMSITKSLVVQMNGEIYVESELGVGSRFTVILPFAAAKNTTECTSVEGETLQTEPEKSLEGCHILLAEDNEVNMEIATEILAMNGIEVSQAWNGAEAVKLFEQSASGTFDAILMDMQMPEMDGCEAARRIRASQKPDGKTVPIIAVTANAFAEDIAATTDAGMDAHVSKPIDFTLLCQTLSKFIKKD